MWNYIFAPPVACEVFQITIRSSKETEQACSPAEAVSCMRVAAPRTVTRPAAVVSEAPVPHHAPLTMWPCHPRLARAVTIAGVTEGHRAERKDSWSNWMTGTHYSREDTGAAVSEPAICRDWSPAVSSHHTAHLWGSSFTHSMYAQRAKAN